MNIKRIVGIAVVALGVVGVAAAVVAARNNSQTLSSAPVFAFAEPDRDVGASTLTRNDERISATLRTEATRPNEALTVWWVVFNDPERCNAPCDADDLFIGGEPAAGLNEAQIEAADIVASYATGKVSTASGRATFDTSLEVNEPAGTREIIFGEGPTLQDTAREAEVHLVLRSHGPAVADIVEEQTGSFAGGCDVFLDPPAQPSAQGECADVLFAVHTP